MQYEVRAEDLKALARDLRGQDNKVIRAKLSKGIRDPLKPAQAQVRAKIRGIPSKGQRSGGYLDRKIHRLKPGGKRGDRYGTLRSRLAAAATVKVSLTGDVSVRIFMDGRKLPPSQGGLPGYVEGLKPWRHPVFGHDVWVVQQAHPYFYSTVLPYRERVQAAIAQVVNEIAAEITQGK